jgi:ribosomal protein L28
MSSRNALVGKIHTLARGLAIYRVKASPFWRVRIWVPSQKKRIVRTTKTTSRVEAIQAAEELLSSMGTRGVLAEVPRDKTFEHFADKLVSLDRARGEAGEISRRQWKESKSHLQNDKWGAIQFFRNRDITSIQTKDFIAYMNFVRQTDSSLSAGTINHIATTFRRVMRVAQSEGTILAIPATPRVVKRKDNPRPYFRFSPDNNEYQAILDEAKKMADDGIVVRGVKVTEELRDFILFIIHTFIRPTESEIYALTHRDVEIAKDEPKRLILTIRQGKTGFRISTTMPAAVSVYNRIQKRSPKMTKDDYLFLPSYPNRSHAKRIVQRQFNVLLERCGLKHDRATQSDHSVYSLRHTAICLRLVKSQGRVNIFNLAKTAGTSVDQIEHFYAKNLALSPEMAKNLQSFGD